MAVRYDSNLDRLEFKVWKKAIAKLIINNSNLDRLEFKVAAYSWNEIC